MISQDFKTAVLPNEVTVLGEQIADSNAVAISMMFSTGCVNDPATELGTCNILTEYFSKGFDGLSAMQASEEFERRGIVKSSSSGTEATSFSAAGLPESLPSMIDLLSRWVQKPDFPDGEEQPIKMLALQDLNALEDDPASKVMEILADKFYPAPFGRSQIGSVIGINAVTREKLIDFYRSCFCQSGLIIGVAGKFDWNETLALVEKAFSSWRGTKNLLEVGKLSPESTTHKVVKDTAQVQLALAYPSVTFGHELFYPAKLLLGILSGGMSGRLFVEVREKRGLVYRVAASHSAMRDRGAIFASAGTTRENRDETLEVMLRELKVKPETITQDELGRAKADLKSRLIMRSESTVARASSLCSDWWNLGELRTIESIKEQIESVAIADIVEYLQAFPVDPITMVILGPE